MKRVLSVAAAALLGAALLVLLKNEYARLLPVSGYGMQAAIEQGEIDHLFIGSSMFRQGLSIDVLEEELPGSSYILSYNGNQPALMAMELAYMLEEGLEVKNLYIDLYPYTAAADPWISDTKILMDTDLAFKADAWKMMKKSAGASFSDFYEFFVTANNEQILTFPVNNRLLSSQFRNGGSLLEQPGKTRDELYAMGALGARDGIHPVQADGYALLAELAKSHGMNLFFLETPKYERMYADEDYMALYDACMEEPEKLQKMWDEEGSFQLIRAQDLVFDSSDAECFQDLIHLSAKGRDLYTELLCRAVTETEDKF